MPDQLQTSSDSENIKTLITEFIYGNRVILFMILIGLILIGSGIILFKNNSHNTDLEIISSENGKDNNYQVVVEIAGSVEKPGVYKLNQGSRIDDLLIASGGLSANADRDWVEKYVNRAAKLIDGQKFYIPKIGEQSSGVSANNLSGESSSIKGTSINADSVININFASQKELESLPGIGPVYAQSIIDHRPYSSIEDLLTKGALKNFVYEKIKDKISVY